MMSLLSNCTVYYIYTLTALIKHICTETDLDITTDIGKLTCSTLLSLETKIAVETKFMFIVHCTV